MDIDSFNRFVLKPIDNIRQPIPDSSKTSAASRTRQVDSADGNPVPGQVNQSTDVDLGKAVAAVEELNDYAQKVGRSLQFSVDDASGKTVIKVMDSETGEVVRQIPPEKVVALMEYLEQDQGLTSTGFVEQA